LQPSSEAVSSVLRSIDGFASGNVLCDGVRALRRATIGPRSRLNVNVSPLNEILSARVD
jgi:hypothetical protein